VAVYRILSGTFALAVRRGVLTSSPVDGLAPSERPKQKNAKRIAVLDAVTLDRLVRAAKTKRWKTAVGLASYAGLRLGEIRGLRWQDIDLGANLVRVERSLLPDGTAKPPKTEAGKREVPLLPALRRLLVEWKLEALHSQPRDLIVGTADGLPVAERNLRRALEEAKTKAKLASGEERLSWHSLRHSFASMLATDLELPATTLARLTGHADAGFTLKVYARDERKAETVVGDVLRRAAGAGVGS
jgi:integrase